jgi:hypothetical protein
MMKALYNPANGAILSWTKELAKRHDLFEIMVNERFERIADVPPSPEKVEDTKKVEAPKQPEEPKRGRKPKQG